MMTAIKICVAACFYFMAVVVSINGKDHNRAQYNVLCDLVKVAVERWGNAGGSLSPPLREALGRTLFGSRGGGTVETLKKGLPEDYKEAEGKTSSRTTWCGKPHEKDLYYGIKQMRFPGHSATHDLVCLCTAGDHGWPKNSGSEKLCGKGPNELGVENKEQGWGIKGQGKDQIQATWTSVTKECLEGDGKGVNLKDALETFVNTLGTLVKGNNSYQPLGEGNFNSDYSCSGTKTQGVCVKYYPEEKLSIPWWKDLKQAIEAEEQEQKKDEEEEKRKQQGQHQHHTEGQEKLQNKNAPHTAALRSTPQDSTEAEQTNQENISSPLATLEEASGTIIAQPCSWLFSAILHI
ncbi:Variant surface glycoprotein [Trypanosoma congolense IL3000]|uniref:Variant surface glycoprotein n=1 Tax=Trypanosoma congolense (strain IL3000) TaxID=1068625 RepID=F9WDI8_TRYCI|nr:Variant surface glycoprotein [Trypanosoma congolense IL3000]